MAGSAVGEKPKLTMEEYSFFLETFDRRFLSVDQLNQIVSMHGFARFRTKKDILASLRPLSLMLPRRSTIGDTRISPFAAMLSVDEIKEDIGAIGWQDCPVNSVLSTRSGEEWLQEAVSISSVAAPAAADQIRKKKKKKKMKNLLSIASPAAAAVSPVTVSWGMKKRRSLGPTQSPLADSGPLLLLADHAETAGRT
ncbi:hypothetical protein J5N97_008843 [Dioscorea zingiberensis]|uniref:DUF7787 domain-containing protein n=1 Tax=Dioscorea zingiberensis TaxID=325984 RepID=A0A9D5CY84_9LILI|nr:hypothetical protein J5N97_008843 [Dioscorea zingiberensis]